ncbi:MAG: restriction endonuclease, partial [Terrimonas sp.]|nr:restriction endonuclease [Terrimonas sp.]
MIKYDLHKLGWYNFQQLCLHITREILGQTVQSFLDSNDGGRDGAFTGNWVRKNGETLVGKFVIQCKHTSKGDYSIKLSDLKDEFTKTKILVDASNCDCYVLITNMGVSGATEAKIKKKFIQAGIKEVLILGYTWICQQIHTNINLRTSVPRLYGLGDLSEILDERAYSQAKALLSSMKDELSKIVITESYKKASKAINDHGFVLLVGEAAAGKTTIASLLAVGALDQWHARTLKLDIPAKIIEHWNADNPVQFFWIDDAFGVTQYESSLARQWNHILPQIKTMLDQGVKIVMTSRDYIYNKARYDLKQSAFPLLEESHVVIDVHELSLEERQQILYNHIKLGRQPREFKSKLKPFLSDIASNDRFIPETARRLSDPIFTKNLILREYNVSEFVEKQEQHLKDTIIGLSLNDQAALGLIYMRKGILESPLKLSEIEENSLTRLGSSLSGCINALESLRGSLVQFVTNDDKSVWQFKHPTIGDAYAAIIVDKPELLGVFIEGSNTEDLLRQITCGDVGLHKAIVITRNLFSIIIRKLEIFTSSNKYKSLSLSKWGAKRDLYTFLARRCNKQFLTEYLHANTQIIDDISSPDLYLEYSAEIDLIVRLYDFEILPEKNRKTFVDVLTKYAIDGDDLYALGNERTQMLFHTSELQNIKDKVLSDLIPRLEYIRHRLVSTYSPEDDDAERHMERYLENLSILQ